MDIEDEIRAIYERLNDTQRELFINKLQELLDEQILSENRAE